MATYDLLIEAPDQRSSVLKAGSDAAAKAQARKSVKADYDGEGDPAVLNARVTLLLSGKPVIESNVAAMLAD